MRLPKVPEKAVNFLGRGESEFFLLDLTTVIVGFALSYMLYVHTFTYKLIPPAVMGAGVVAYFALFLGPNLFFREKKERNWIVTYLVLGFVWSLFLPISPLFLTAVFLNVSLSVWFFVVYFILVPVFLTIFRYLKHDGFFVLVFYAWLVEDVWIGRQVLLEPLNLSVLAFTIFAWIFQYYPVYVLTSWIHGTKVSKARNFFDAVVVVLSTVVTARLVVLQIQANELDSFLAGVQISVLLLVLVFAVLLKTKKKWRRFINA